MNPDWLPLGDAGLLLRFGDRADIATSVAVHRARSQLLAAAIPGLRAVSAAYGSLALDLDLSALAQAGGEEALRAAVMHALVSTPEPTSDSDKAAVLEIPVRYGGDDGPDLNPLAQTLGCTPDQIIALHSAPLYRVAMVGFRPGFPYLLGLSPKLVVPRRASPRRSVAAGSVAIAGEQAGIYPETSPGGWHLLGRTELRMFDPQRTPPALLRPGDGVRFVPV